MEKITLDKEKPSITPTGTLRKEIGDSAYASYKKYKDRGDSNSRFELLFGGADEYSTILYVKSDGKTQELTKFGIIGSGRITGGELLPSELLKEDMSQDDAALLAALVVTTVGHVDLSVGGQPDIQMCSDRQAWIFKEESFERILDYSESRWNLMKKVWWKMHEDKTIQSKLRTC